MSVTKMAGICSLNPTTLMTFKVTSKGPALQLIHSVEVSIFKLNFSLLSSQFTSINFAEIMELDAAQEQQIMKIRAKLELKPHRF